MHKEIYSGPEGSVSLMIVQELLWICARYTLDLTKKENLYATVEVAEAVFEALRNKGVKYVYCTADSHKAFKFNEMLGFRSVNALIHDKYEIMEKEL